VTSNSERNSKEKSMEKQKLVINDVMPAKAKSGKDYYKVSTSEGSYTCFESDVATFLMAWKGHLIEADVIVSDDGKYKTIKSIKDLGIAQNMPQTQPESHNTPKETRNESREASVRVGVAYRFAVDLCVAGKIDIAQIDDFAANFLTKMAEVSQ
jgi:hypothetical protein